MFITFKLMKEALCQQIAKQKKSKDNRMMDGDFNLKSYHNALE